MTTIIVTITTETPIRDPGVKKQHIELLQRLINFNTESTRYWNLKVDIKKNFTCLKPWARITLRSAP